MIYFFQASDDCIVNFNRNERQKLNEINLFYEKNVTSTYFFFVKHCLK